MRISSVVLALAVLTGACAAPSTRIATGLQRYGLDPARSQCVGDRLEASLSLGQLRQLGRAAAAYGRDDPDPGRLSFADLVRVAAEIEDPKVPIEIGKAAIACGVA